MKIVKDTYPLLEPFQRVGVDFLSRSRSALLADDVGTGKTAQGIHACQQVGARSVLVICTASIKDNWKKEAHKRLTDDPWQNIIEDWSISNPDEICITTQHVYRNILSGTLQSMHPGHLRRIAQALKNLGWVKRRGLKGLEYTRPVKVEANENS